MYVKYRALKLHPASFSFTPAIQTHKARKVLPLSSVLPLEVPHHTLRYAGSQMQDFTYISHTSAAYVADTAFRRETKNFTISLPYDNISKSKHWAPWTAPFPTPSTLLTDQFLPWCCIRSNLSNAQWAYTDMRNSLHLRYLFLLWKHIP